MGGSLAALGVAALLVLLALGAVVRRHLSLLAAVLLIWVPGFFFFRLAPSGNILILRVLYVKGWGRNRYRQDHTAYEIGWDGENRQGRFLWRGNCCTGLWREEEPLFYKAAVTGVIEEARGRRNRVPITDFT